MGRHGLRAIVQAQSRATCCMLENISRRCPLQMAEPDVPAFENQVEAAANSVVAKANTSAFERENLILPCLKG